MGKTDQPASGSVSRFLRRAFVKERPFLWSPGRIGPQFEWLDYTHIRFREGALKGSRFELVTEILETKANVYISEQGSQVARACVERDPPGKGVCLSEIAVDEPYRRKGLASIMTYCIFRELLAMQETAFFKIRMMRMLKPTERNVEVQNVGIGVIANRLGFTPELIVEKILSPSNVTGIEILPAKGDFPPSFKILARTFPLVVIAFVLDADTMKPVADFRTYVKLSKEQPTILELAQKGLIVIGNGSYWLRRDGIDQFVNHLATDEHEASAFRRRVRGV